MAKLASFPLRSNACMAGEISKRSEALMLRSRLSPFVRAVPPLRYDDEALVQAPHACMRYLYIDQRPPFGRTISTESSKAPLLSLFCTRHQLMT